MRALIVHNKEGQIGWLAIQDSEIEGELALDVGKDELVLELELGDDGGGVELRQLHAHGKAEDLVRGYSVNVAQRKLVRRDEA